MRSLLIACIFTCMALTKTLAQTNAEPNLKFDQPFARCELKWVVLPPKGNAPDPQYYYGFLYVDEVAGYTIDVKGNFKIAPDGRYIADTTISQNKSFKVRLGPNTVKMALLPESRFAELHVQPRPKWVDLYYKDVDTNSVSHYYRRGFALNAANDSEDALPYLNKAYKIDPNYKGLIFEITYAYNSLNQYDKAIAMLKDALKAEPQNVMLFRELGYAYKKKGDDDNAISWYKQGIALCTDAQNDARAEMGYNLAYIYKAKGDDAGFKDMMGKVKTWALVNSQIYRAVVQAGF